MTDVSVGGRECAWWVQDIDDEVLPYMAMCECGWNGPRRDVYEPAREDGDRHGNETKRALLTDSAVPPEASTEAVEGDVAKLIRRLRDAAEYEGCIRAVDPDTTCPKVERDDPSDWCIGCAAEQAANLLASGQTPVTREPEFREFDAWWTPRCRSCDGWLTWFRDDHWFCETCDKPRSMGSPAVSTIRRAQAPSEPSREPCRIHEYDGAFKCYTHDRKWGAVSNPDEPCVSEPSPDGERLDWLERCAIALYRDDGEHGRRWVAEPRDSPNGHGETIAEAIDNARLASTPTRETNDES